MVWDSDSGKRPPRRWVVREDMVSESEFLGRAWPAWGSCGDDVRD